MKMNIHNTWTTKIRPISDPVRHAQVAALCFRMTPAGREVLLITSRDTGRWIIPKGWPIKGLDGPATALEEAWEEAGVRDADIRRDPIGQYHYDKRLDDGTTTPIDTTVYLAEVTKLEDDFPEVTERTRVWVTPAEAAKRVDEPELKDILRSL